MYLLTNKDSLLPLMNNFRNKRIAMLGEASHGTHEYYTWRTAISKRLIMEQGFHFIAVEGDWPDCYKINRYVKGYKDAGDDIIALLNTFDRWPTWMWANWEVAAFAEWLRDYNKTLPANQKVGFYGLDVYSLWDSMRTIVDYLEKEDPQAAQSVRKAIHCFEPYGEDEHLYARHSLSQHRCRDEVVAMLREIRMKAQFLDGDREAGFNTEQNALIAVNAEKYYSSMIGFDDNSWNIRDTHMMQTLHRLLQFHGDQSKGIVWEHNTHIGDARATDMKRSGTVNIGQLAREQYGNDAVHLTGFSSYTGTVIAGSGWGEPMQVMDVPEAREGSIEEELHAESNRNRYYLFSEPFDKRFSRHIKHRAIGVVYNPLQEKWGNYVPSLLSQRYDAFVFIDKTKALHPLHGEPHNQRMPETYPFGT